MQTVVKLIDPEKHQMLNKQFIVVIKNNIISGSSGTMTT